MPHLRPPRPRPSFLSSLFISFLALAPVIQVAAVNALRTRAEARSLSWEQLEDVFRQGTVEEGKDEKEGGRERGPRSESMSWYWHHHYSSLSVVVYVCKG